MSGTSLPWPGMDITPGDISFGGGMRMSSGVPMTGQSQLGDLSGLGRLGGGGDNGWFGTSLGPNMGTAQLALGGLQSLGNLLGSFQAQSMAKKQFNFDKDFANANLANQIKSYNTRLEGRARSQAHTEGAAPGWADEYVARNRLTR
jgi:hypothetical protein